MLGMTRSTKKKINSKVIGRGHQISPSKVLAIVANWNNTAPEQEDALMSTQRNKRPRDEKHSSSAHRYKQNKLRKAYLSVSDDEEVPSFKAKSFYQSKGQTKYQSPLERKEERDRLVDAGIDPDTVNKSVEDLKKERSSVNAVSETTTDAKRISSVEGRNVTNKKTVVDNKCVKKLDSSMSKMKTVPSMQSGRSSAIKGEVKVILSQKVAAAVVSSTGQIPRRTSPRKLASKASATKGIQLYMKNLKSVQKKGKKSTTTSLKLKYLPKENKIKAEDCNEQKLDSITQEGRPVEHEKAIAGDKTVRGLDFGISEVKGEDLTPLNKNFDEANVDQNENGLLNVSFQDEDTREPSDTIHLIQNLLQVIDDDLDEASTSLKRSPRKRRMKTEAESMASPSKSPKSNPVKKVRLSAPLSSQKSQSKLEEWLWHHEPDASSPRQKKTEVQRSKSKVDSPTILTPESTGCESPKASTTKTTGQAVKLYPVFTPPTSPSVRNSSTPSGKKKSIEGKVTSPKQSKRAPILKTLKSKNDLLEQMTLDLGQKKFGAVTCSTCGTVYTVAHPEDEADHAKFHKKYLSSIKFPGWKQEDVLEEFHDGRIIVVTHDAPRYAAKKVDEIRELVDQELGFLEGNPLSCKELCKTYLFITIDKKVGGCLIAEQITKGYRVIVDESLSDGSITESQKAWCCETESEHALCGISRIWVPMAMRKKGIARRMVDCLRTSFTYGTILTPNNVAFSDPTPDGKVFATKYTGTPRFLVYKYH